MTGPTHPHRRDQPATSAQGSKFHITDGDGLSALVDLVDADINDGRAGLDHVGGHEARLAHGDENRIGGARMDGEIAVMWWHTVTVAPSDSSRKAMGLPTISEWPITTTLRPSSFRPVRLRSSTEAAAVHGASATSR